MESVRGDRVLLARPEDELLAADPEPDKSAAAAERLLLSGRAVERRVAVLRACLARIEDELLRAVAVGVHVDEHQQAELA